MMFITSLCLSQKTVIVTQPSLFVDFAKAHQINDSIVKYYLTSSSTKSASNDHLIVLTFNLNNQQVHTDTLRDPVDNYFRLRSAYGFWSILMPDGSLILGTNNFECDITFSELIYYDKNGNVIWYIDPYEFEIYIQNIQSIGLVSSDVLAIEQSGEQPWLYIALSGEQKYFDIPPPVYYNPFKLNGYWYVTRDDKVLKLNDSFEVVSYYSTDSIRFFQPVSDGKLLVGAGNNIYLLDTLLNELNASADLPESISGEASENSIWIATNDAIYELDTNLVILTSYSPQPNETVHYVSSKGQKAYVASTYDGLVHQDFVIREYAEDTTFNPTLHDLSLAIQIPEKVIRIPNEQIPYLYQLRFDSILFVIKNNSIDTIESFNINYDWDTYYWCSSIHGEWIIDSLQILPYDSGIVRLDSFITQNIGFHVFDPFCFWVDFPDINTDVQPLNNYQCGNAEIVLGTTPSVADKGIMVIYPNPSSNKIYVNSGSLNVADEIRIYTADGYQIHFKSNCQMPCEVIIKDLLPGIYRIQVITDNRTETKSFVKL